MDEAETTTETENEQFASTDEENIDEQEVKTKDKELKKERKEEMDEAEKTTETEEEQVASTDEENIDMIDEQEVKTEDKELKKERKLEMDEAEKTTETEEEQVASTDEHDEENIDEQEVKTEDKEVKKDKTQRGLKEQKTPDTDEKIEFSDLEFHEQLGEGGFGSVNRVTFRKPYKGYSEAAAKSVVDFRKEEVLILAKLSHEHIVDLIGFYQNGPVKIILLEYAQQGSLYDYLSNMDKPLPIDLKRKWIRESALGIQYLHSNKCLHRDIKAKNCLIFCDHVLKIADFGLARETDHSITVSSQKGTFQYMAPELIATLDRKKASYSKFADIYSYGMLVLEICTRQTPFHDMEIAYVIYNVGCGKLRPSIPAECPQDLAKLMEHCWNLNPRKRPTICCVIKAISGQMNALDENGTKEHEEELSHALRPYDLPFVLTKRKEIYPLFLSKPIRADLLACCPNDDFIISDVSKLYLCSPDGICKTQMTSSEHQTEKRIGYVSGIAVSHKGHVLVADNTRYVKLFELPLGNYSHCFSSFTDDEDPYRTTVELSCVAFDDDGQALVGDYRRGIITFHKCPDGRVVKKVACGVYNIISSMVVNSKKQILRHFHPKGMEVLSSSIVAIDYIGKGSSFHLQTPPDMVLQGVWLRGMVCDTSDNIYLSVRVEHGSKTTNMIHKYNATGEYMGAVTEGLYFPYCLSISHDGSSLFVANDRTVLVYKMNGISSDIP